MKTFNALTVRRMAQRNGHTYVYKPFPGKWPVRLNVDITFYVEERRAGKWLTRFSYDGHWSYPILRRALRIWNQLLKEQTQNPNMLLNSRVHEYCQTGVVYTGDLFHGTYSPGHGLSHLFSPTNKGSLRFAGDYRIEKLLPVRCDNFSMMIPEATVLAADTRERRNILYREMRQTRKRWEAV